MADKGFEWIQLWSAWRTQTPEIQRGWMMGLGGLKTHLEDFMKNYPRDVQDDLVMRHRTCVKYLDMFDHQTHRR
jgi:hypothetical protein